MEKYFQYQRIIQTFVESTAKSAVSAQTLYLQGDLMNIEFTAKTIHASKEDDFYIVGFSDDEYDYSNYLILQKAFEFDEQDVEHGMDGEYFELNGQEYSGYKLCRAAFISKDEFLLHINQNDFGIDTVKISLSQVVIDTEFLQHLKKVLNNKITIID